MRPPLLTHLGNVLAMSALTRLGVGSTKTNMSRGVAASNEAMDLAQEQRCSDFWVSWDGQALESSHQRPQKTQLLPFCSLPFSSLAVQRRAIPHRPLRAACFLTCVLRRAEYLNSLSSGISTEGTAKISLSCGLISSTQQRLRERNCVCDRM